jgi:GT2 family glycosyltransferase
MGFAANIGIQQSPDSDVIVLTSSDVYHPDNSVHELLKIVGEDHMALATPREVYDDDGRLIHCLNSKHGVTESVENVRRLVKQNNDVFQSHPDMPFFTAVRRDLLMSVGGYDEDMTGVAADDNDLMDRLLASGCHYVRAESSVIHLYHGRRIAAEKTTDPRYQFNLNMWRNRKGIIVRNVGREWGRI